MALRPKPASGPRKRSVRAIAKAAAMAAAVLSLSLLLVEANGSGLPLALLFGFLSVFFVMAINALLESNAEAYLRKRLEEGTVEFLYRVTYYKRRGGSYLRAVGKAVNGTADEGTKRIAGRASKGLMLGGGLASGIASGGEFRGEALLRNLRLSGTDDLGQVRCALAAHELRLGERQSAIEESSQRYAITNMFISTIVPSFLVFAFIGSAILSPAGFSMLLFSVSLLIFIPLSYAIGNSLLSRRLYG